MVDILFIMIIRNYKGKILTDADVPLIQKQEGYRIYCRRLEKKNLMMKLSKLDTALMIKDIVG